VKSDTLPTGAKERKEYPIATGVLDYFPDALAAISHVSFAGSQQHHPGEPLHWDRSKSTDHADTMQRHFLQRGTLDTDGQRHSAKMAWRALALLQTEIEQERKQEPALRPTYTAEVDWLHTCGCRDRNVSGCTTHKTGIYEGQP
jgi:hypothetical protein